MTFTGSFVPRDTMSPLTDTLQEELSLFLCTSGDPQLHHLPWDGLCAFSLGVGQSPQWPILAKSADF